MRIQIKVIRFVAFMSVILSAITYLVSLNIEVGFLKLNAPWISNNFVLTVFALFPFDNHTQSDTARKAAPVQMIGKILFMILFKSTSHQI